jgi:ribonuclease J
VRENEGLIEELRLVAAKKLYELEKSGKYDKNAMKNTVRDELKSYIFKKTKRNPVIVTVFAEA